MTAHLKNRHPRAATFAAAVLAVEVARGDLRGGWYRRTAEPHDDFFVAHGGLADREVVRDYFETMLPQVAAMHLLVIAGSAGAGKTYTYHLIHHIAQRLRHRTANTDLLEFDRPDRGGDLQEILSHICDELLLPAPDVETLTTTVREARQAARTLARMVRQRGEPTWLVFDHVDGATHTPQVEDFIQHLARRTMDAGNQHRVVVIGRTLTRDFLGIEPANVLLNEPERVTRDNVATFFRRLSEHVDGVAWPDAEIDAASQQVWSESSEGRQRLPATLWAVADARFNPEHPHG